MRPLFLLSIFTTGLFVFTPTPVYACSCLTQRALQDTIANTDVIFLGRVTGMGEDGLKSAKLRVGFDVEDAWKGLPSGPSGAMVWTQKDSATCGYTFTIGEEYLVYVSSDLHVSLCSETKLKSQAAEDLKLLAAQRVPTPPPSLNSFLDVPSSHQNAEAIAYLKAKNIIHGYSDGTFRSEKPINRAEFVKIVVGMKTSESDRNMYLEGEISTNGINFFPDVPLNSWFAPYIAAARNLGLVGGYNDGLFRPENHISFAESAKILVRHFVAALEHDSDIWFRPEVTRMGELSAIPISILRFYQPITRGEMAEMMYRLDANITNKSSQTYTSIFEDNGY